MNKGFISLTNVIVFIVMNVKLPIIPNRSGLQFGWRPENITTMFQNTWQPFINLQEWL